MKAQTIDYLEDQEKVMAHKRAVMQKFKTILFAPVVLTTNLASNTIKLFSGISKGLGKSNGASTSEDNLHKLNLQTQQEGLDEGMSSFLSLELCVSILNLNKETLGRVLVITYAVESHRT